MHSLRGAALRALLGASTKAPASTPSLCSAASRTAQRDAVSRIAAPRTVRFFSQTQPITSEPTNGEQRLAKEETITQTEENVQEAMQETKFPKFDYPPPLKTTDPNEVEPKPVVFTAFVRNLVFELTEEHLEKAFSKYGKVVKTFIARDPGGLSKGYGFVSFEKKDDLMAACEAVDGSFWHGRRITCIPRNPTNVDSGKYYRNKNSPQQPTAQLFIGNMPYETTDADLNRLFRGIKNIKAVRVAVDRTTGWPRGFAHADFTSVEAATEAKRILEGITIAGRPLRIDYAEGYQRNRPTERPRAEKEFTTGSESDGSSSQW